MKQANQGAPRGLLKSHLNLWGQVTRGRIEIHHVSPNDAACWQDRPNEPACDGMAQNGPTHLYK